MAPSSSLGIFQIVLLLCGSLVLAASVPGVRKEWRSLTSTEKKNYIDAVKCLQRKPSVLRTDQTPGAVTRFDDIVLIHQSKAPHVHFNGQFLPWHRYFTLLHEASLRYECGYKGYQPYWDQSLDLPPKGTWLESPLFDPQSGFGGNGVYKDVPENFTYYGVDMTPLSLSGGPTTDARGNALVQSLLPVLASTRTGGGCVTNGPFRDLRIRLGPNNSTQRNERCLTRDFATAFVQELSLPALLQQVDATESYLQLIETLEPVHVVGHAGVGGVLGEMFDLYTSPSDPLFFLHHAYVDRVWWNWQKANLSQRLYEVSGYAYSTGDETVTLDFPLDLGAFGITRPISDFMDIRELGYTYAT